MTPDQIYSQCIDKQRVVITGDGSQFITLLILHVLKNYNRKFDFVLEGQEPALHNDSPTVIIQGSTQLLDYKHHIGVISEFSSGAEAKLIEQFADATPKGGSLIYSDNDAKAKLIGSKERVDIQAIPFRTYQHVVLNGKTILISSTNEKITINLSEDLHLQYVSAAKEILKKIGITSDQFYKSLPSFQLN